MAKESTVFLPNFRLDEELYERYSSLAKAADKSVYAYIVEHLKRTQAFTAIRPMYFNDPERNELERLLGGHILQNAEQALVRLKNALTLRVDGITLTISQDKLNRLRARCPRSTPFDKFLQKKFFDNIDWV